MVEMESQSEQSESQGRTARLQKRKQRATASEESKAKVREVKRRNDVVSRNLAWTGRAIFQIIQAARGILLRTLRIPSNNYMVPVRVTLSWVPVPVL